MTISTITHIPTEAQVSTEDVPVLIQAITSDIVYKIFYSSISEVRHLLVRGAHKKTLRSAVISSFSEAKKELIPMYPDVEDINMTIENIVVSNNTLFVLCNLDITTLEETDSSIVSTVEVKLENDSPATNAPEEISSYGEL